MAEKSVFVSYAHEDEKWLEFLETHLAPWLRQRHWGVWTDKDIAAGAQWERDIERAMAAASVAVLLVSKDFLASAFINDVELPVLLKKEKAGTLRLIPIAVGHAAIDVSPLAAYQFANPIDRPLQALGGADRDRVMVDIARQISNALTIAGLAHGLAAIDETAEPFEARVEERPVRLDHEHRVEARFRPETDEIAFSGATEKITYDDLDKLSEDDREYIADLERTMKKHYGRWRDIREKLGAAGGAMDDEINDELARIGRLMCDDLSAILDFLKEMLKYELEDHYGRYRHICDRLQSMPQGG